MIIIIFAGFTLFGFPPAAARLSRSRLNRLARRGWLLPTAVRGSWEFVPADRAGPFSSQEPWLPLLGAITRRPELPLRIALGSALWVMGLTDRGPDRPEITAPRGIRVPPILSSSYRITHFTPVLPPLALNGLPVEAPATLLTHLTERPAAVRSWEAVLAAMPRLVDRVNQEDLAAELAGRTAAPRARFGRRLEAFNYPDDDEGRTVCD